MDFRFAMSGLRTGGQGRVWVAETNPADLHAQIYGLKRESEESDEALQQRVEDFIQARTPEEEREE
jgi:exosome complex RNA-binding protein Rrp4